MSNPRDNALVQDRTLCRCGHERRAHVFGNSSCTEYMRHGATAAFCPCVVFGAPAPLSDSSDSGFRHEASA